MGYSPKCPYCETNDYVVLEKKFSKAGTVVGGVAGAAGATSGGAGGAATGAAVGYTAGKQIDKYVGKYRCERCKNTFEADVDDYKDAREMR